MGQQRVDRVVVADAHPLERLGILAVLAQAFSCDTVDVAANLAELVASLEYGADIAVIDEALPGLTSVEDLRQLRLAYPGVKLVLVSSDWGVETVFAGLRAGAQGFIAKTLGTDEMAEALGLILGGHVYVPPQLCDGQSPCTPALMRQPAPGKQLSTRQRQVLELACEGASNKEIARKLAISEATVKVHVGAAFRAIGVSNRTHAAAVFRQQGFSLSGESGGEHGIVPALNPSVLPGAAALKTGLKTLN